MEIEIKEHGNDSKKYQSGLVTVAWTEHHRNECEQASSSSKRIIGKTRNLNKLYIQH